MATAPSAERAFRHASEVESLANRFEALSLTRAEWTHRAHLTMALWYRSRLEHDEALATVRRGILRLNETLGIVSTPTSGYHETITRFYMRMVGGFVESDLADGDWAATSQPALRGARREGSATAVLHGGPPHVFRGPGRLDRARYAAVAVAAAGTGQRERRILLSLVIRRRTEPSWTRSPTRTIAPPRISGSSENDARTCLPSCLLKAS